MPGERVLVIDSSSAVQEIARSCLAEAGYKVRTAANGMAALANPELQDIDLVILDAALEGVDGYTATREIKTDATTYQSLVLLLIPEEEVGARESPELRGADGYLFKPFEPAQLQVKARGMLEERELAREVREHLDRAADEMMGKLAEKHLQGAAEKKTQLIVERALQNVVTQIDQRVGQEVNARVTQLTTEKEQELVRTTVHEVAKSMVEKLAERKVNEAIENSLAEETEKAVRRASDKSLPGQIRERLKESLDMVLPREINSRIQDAMREAVPELYKEMSKMFDDAAGKVVKKVAREQVPEILENQLQSALLSAVPKLVNDALHKALSEQTRQYVTPEVERARKRLTVLSIVFFVINLLLIGGFIAAQAFGLLTFGGGGG